MRLRIEHEGKRIQITQEILDRLSSLITGTVSGFAKEKRLPYLLIYNLVHGRVKSVSARNYRRIFHEEPPDQELKRVDGKHFRNLVRLWVFLHGDATEKDLYRELHSGKEYAKTDYRIFSGKTRTVKSGLQKAMERKFLDHGLGKPEIEKWLQELDESRIDGKVSYQEAKPALDYLRKVLKVSVTHLLNQSISRYETGELKTISVKKHREILDLKEKAGRALRSGSRFEIEKLREKICGKRRNMVLFSEIEDQLEFLREFGGESPKRYLGRSIGHYKRSNLLRIACWRAEKITLNCGELIRERPELPFSALPRFHRLEVLSGLVDSLKSVMIRKLIDDESRTFEKIILTPSTGELEECKEGKYIAMEEAPLALGMSRKAFDHMVAANTDLIKTLTTYDGRWHLPEQFIKQLKEKYGFGLVKEKYEWLAEMEPGTSGMRDKRGVVPDRSDPPSSETMLTQAYGPGQGVAYFLTNGESGAVDAVDFASPGHGVALHSNNRLISGCPTRQDVTRPG